MNLTFPMHAESSQSPLASPSTKIVQEGSTPSPLPSKCTWGRAPVCGPIGKGIGQRTRRTPGYPRWRSRGLFVFAGDAEKIREASRQNAEQSARAIGHKKIAQ